MTITYAVINGIEKETEKAILVNANGQCWLPKSQIEILSNNVIKLPTWLWLKNRFVMSIRTNAESIAQA